MQASTRLESLTSGSLRVKNAAMIWLAILLKQYNRIATMPRGRNTPT
jgi:hypothetical protein